MNASTLAGVGCTPLEALVLVGAVLLRATACAVNVLLIESAITTGSRATRITTVVLLSGASLFLSVLFLPVGRSLSFEWTTRLVFALAFVVPALSGILPFHRLGWLHQWTVRGTAARIARRSLARRRAGLGEDDDMLRPLVCGEALFGGGGGESAAAMGNPNTEAPRSNTP